MNSKPFRHTQFGILLLSIIAFSPQSHAGSCVSNCLSVWSISLTDLGTSIRASVKMVDEFNSSGASRNSTVHGLWTRPDGTTVLQYARIGTRLRADFKFYTGGVTGAYTFEAIDVIKSGYTFDPSGGVDPTATITIQDSGNQLPIAVINTDQVSGEAPLDVSFDAQSSTDPDGIITRYFWRFGDGATSSLPSLIHTYSVSGSYTATLTVYDSSGAQASSSVTIDATAPSSPNNNACLSQCLALDEFKMSFKQDMVVGKIRVMDENGNTLNDVTIDAFWSLPDGSSVSQTQQNGANKLTGFKIPALQSGTYTLTATAVSKSGYQYAPALNVEASGSFLKE